MTKDMTKGRIIPQLTEFTIPLVLGNLFQLTYNAADSVIVGKFVGDDALAAVGTARTDHEYGDLVHQRNVHGRRNLMSTLTEQKNTIFWSGRSVHQCWADWLFQQ